MTNAALAQLVPRAHQMGVRFVEMRPGHVRAELPFEGNGNHFGTVYAGVIFTLAEVLGGAMHWVSFDGSTHYPLVRSMSIDFVAPGSAWPASRVRAGVSPCCGANPCALSGPGRQPSARARPSRRQSCVP